MNRLEELTLQAQELEKEIEKEYETYVDALVADFDMEQEGVEYLIMPIGLHYEPLIMTLMMLNPKKILFLYTKGSKIGLEKIKEKLCLDASKFDAFEVDKVDPLKVYKIIDETHRKWGKPTGVFIDISGGTKAMAVACAMAGINIDAKYIYLTSDNYLKCCNREELGKEKLIKFKNPLKIYGDLDEEIALDHMQAYDYVSATEIFKQIINQVPDGNRRTYYKILYLLSSGYEYWDNLEFKDAYTCFEDMIQLIERNLKKNPRCILGDKLEELRLQKEILYVLAYEFNNSMNFEIVKNIDNVLALVMTIYRSAKRRKSQEKYDMAVLLLYRMIEVIGQRRLASHGINYEDPNFFEVLGQKKYAYMKIRFSQLKNEVFDDFRTYKPPRRHITLIDGYFILAVLKDKIYQHKDKIEYLQKIYNFCKIRNQSIYAHGYKIINQDDYLEFERFCEKLLFDFCRAENIKLAMYRDKVKFINPESSKYIG